MPILKDHRQTTKVVLPASSTEQDEAWVEIYTEVLTKDIIGVAELQTNPTLAGIATITKLIKDWNFVTDSGEKAEITEDMVGLLPLEDVNEIMTHVTSLTKSSLPTSKKKS